MVTPPLISPGSSDSGCEDKQKKRTEHNTAKGKERLTQHRNAECSNNEQFGLQCFEEAAGALCNRTSAEHELHHAYCWS